MIESVYSFGGRRLPSKILCLKCRFPVSEVVATSQDESGVTVRKRRCKKCEHVFFTAQEPEYIVKGESVAWKNGKLSLRDHSTPLESLRLSTGVFNALMRAGYVTVGAVAELTDGQIMLVRGIGAVSLTEIRSAIRRWRESPEFFDNLG